MNLALRVIGTGVALLGGAMLAWIGGASAKPSTVNLARAGLAAPRAAAAPLFTDLELSRDGALRGFCRDGQGRPIADSMIELRQRETVIAETKTDRAGAFHLTGLRGGTYRIGRDGAWQAIRLWSAGAAPPAAHGATLVVHGEASMNSTSAIEAAYGADEGPARAAAPPIEGERRPTVAPLAAAIVAGVRDDDAGPVLFELPPANN